ncbi:MAG: aminoacyl-histidine dipeptidase [Candidatus Heteroscillospira sp.]|jgi:dipeptidase D
MAVLENLEPKRVFRFFEELCGIPHGSGNTGAAADWLVSFAQERGLEYHRDALNNVIIIMEASSGCEGKPAVILQGHTDMVCEKAPGCTLDMGRDALELTMDGDSIYAKGTTLGGDDGIAVAMAMAVLDAPPASHPRIEAVFTSDEEVGLIGAVGLDVSPLRGRMMLNIDSEVEGVFTVSCAGGATVKCTVPVIRESFEGSTLKITVGGLHGGHSGIDIVRQGGNANMLMGRVLAAVGGKTDMRLVSVSGGMKDNVIPQECAAVVSASDAEAVSAVCAQMEEIFRGEHRISDPGVFVTVSGAEAALCMDADSTKRAVCLLVCSPNGVQAMSADIHGLVQTSLNLGILSCGDSALSASFSVRSSVESQKAMLIERLELLATQLGGGIDVAGDYPGWEYAPESPLRDLMVQVYTEQYGHEPKIETIHAGLECGIFSHKLPGLDCVSFGPNLTDIHTCREKMSISSVQRVWAMLTEVIARL